MVINLRVEVCFKMHSVFYFLSLGEIEDSERSYSLSCSILYKEVCYFYESTSSFLMDMKKGCGTEHYMAVYVWFKIFGRIEAIVLCLWLTGWHWFVASQCIPMYFFQQWPYLREKYLNLLKRTFKLWGLTSRHPSDKYTDSFFQEMNVFSSLY